MESMWEFIRRRTEPYLKVLPGETEEIREEHQR
jgi:hypothetical protein